MIMANILSGPIGTRPTKIFGVKILKNYQIDFSYMIEEYGTVTIAAMDAQEADEMAREYVRDTFEDAKSITVEEIKELN